MSIAEKVCLTFAFVFFLTGLLTGVWKYWHMARSDDASAPTYVDIAHRSSLLYSFAAILLGQLAAVSAFSDPVNTLAALAALVFFALAITAYIVHGILRDTDNQLRRPHVLGAFTLPDWSMTLAMLLLIAGEVGGFVVLGSGAMIGLWG